MEFIVSQRGNPKILLDGYVYVRLKELANGYVSYECENRRKGRCRAKIKVRGDEFTKGAVGHTHGPETGRPEKMRAEQGIKRRAIDTQETPQQILSNAFENLSEESMSYTGRFGFMAPRHLRALAFAPFNWQPQRLPNYRSISYQQANKVKNLGANTSRHICGFVTKRVVYVCERPFHTTSRCDVPGPAILLLIKKAAKVGAVLIGRTLRRSIPKHKDPDHSHHKLRIAIGVLLAAGFLWTVISYNLSKQDTPFTGRTRYLPFSNEQFKSISGFEAEAILDEYKGKVVPGSSESTVRVREVLLKLIAANWDLEFFRNQKWTVQVIDHNEINAVAFPTGLIVVFTGLLKLAENDDQLAVILAHELAHVYLSHGAEKMSIVGLVENILIFLTLGVWALMPGDISSALLHFLYDRLLKVMLHLPYSRMLEEEADDVGLHLMAKACFDVREASNLWRLMASLYILADVDEVPSFLSTHPHNLERSSRLDSMTDVAMKTRLAYRCSKLPEKDPREYGKQLYEQALKAAQQQEEESERT